MSWQELLPRHQGGSLYKVEGRNDRIAAGGGACWAATTTNSALQGVARCFNYHHCGLQAKCSVQYLTPHLLCQTNLSAVSGQTLLRSHHTCYTDCHFAAGQVLLVILAAAAHPSPAKPTSFTSTLMGTRPSASAASVSLMVKPKS